MHPKFLNRKQQQKIGKTVLIMWSQVRGTKNLCVQKLLLKKVQKLKTAKTKNHKSVHNLWQLIRTKLGIFVKF